MKIISNILPSGENILTISVPTSHEALRVIDFIQDGEARLERLIQLENFLSVLIKDIEELRGIGRLRS